MNMKAILGTLILTGVLIFGASTIVSAQSPRGGSNAASPAGTCTGVECKTQQQTNPTGFNLAVKIKNPLKVNTIQDVVRLVVSTIVRIAIPIVVISFIWSGLQFILARGNPTALGKARQTFFYTVIGTLLILGAWAITNAIVGTVNLIAS